MDSHGYGGQDRRRFLQSGTMLLATTLITGVDTLFADKRTSVEKPLLRIALITDAHYADKNPRINRYYRESTEKINAFVKQCKTLDPDFTVELGDLIDSGGDVDLDLETLRTANEVFQKSAGQRHYVLGNHCVETLMKREFMKEVGKENTYYSFDRKGHHFIVLDGCFRKDGTPYGRKNFHWTESSIPEEEIRWLREDLRNTDQPTIVLAHQCLDTEDHYSVANALEVRSILEGSGRVKLVLQGHYHKGRKQTLQGIVYCTLHAMVEGSGSANNAFSFLDIHDDGRFVLNGYFKQSGLEFENHA